MPQKYISSKIKSKIRRKRYGLRKTVYTSAKRVAFMESDQFDDDGVSFDLGGSICVLHNSTNSHIWNKKSDFVEG